MTSNLPSRLSWAASESGNGLPEFCEDDVVNFLVTEAIVEKAAIERNELQEQARRQAKRDAWRSQHKDLATPLGVG